MFVGRLPTPVFSDSTSLTLENLQLKANESFDEDGGNVTCVFKIPYDDGSQLGLGDNPFKRMPRELDLD